MKKFQLPLSNDVYSESWKEELARAKKYKEATQKRTHETEARKEAERLKRKVDVGRIKIEP